MSFNFGCTNHHVGHSTITTVAVFAPIKKALAQIEPHGVASSSTSTVVPTQARAALPRSSLHTEADLPLKTAPLEVDSSATTTQSEEALYQEVESLLAQLGEAHDLMMPKSEEEYSQEMAAITTTLHAAEAVLHAEAELNRQDLGATQENPLQHEVDALRAKLEEAHARDQTRAREMETLTAKLNYETMLRELHKRLFSGVLEAMEAEYQARVRRLQQTARRVKVSIGRPTAAPVAALEIPLIVTVTQVVSDTGVVSQQFDDVPVATLHPSKSKSSTSWRVHSWAALRHHSE